MSPISKLLLWTYIPTHHQSAFLQALRDNGVDLVVHYFKRLDPQRLRLGWADPETLPEGERFVEQNLSALDACPDWRERLHVVPGYGAIFLLRLALKLSLAQAAWVNWCEPSRDWPRWYLTYPLKRAYAALINRRALGALAIGSMARDDFMRWGVSERLIRFLPYSSAGLESLPYAARAAVSGGLPRFVFVGALCHRKGIDVLLRAFHEVWRHHPAARLRLVGYDESDGVYRRLAAEMGITQAVEFSGSIPASLIANIIGDCDVLVLPSRFDGWGMVLNEGASLGKALIATNACGAAHHLIVPEANGFRVPHSDFRALAGAMQRYCQEPSLARRHGDRSREMFLDFTPARNARRMRECLASLGADEVVSSWEAA
jgi:glycosyltransferase involved in cell wall biosynthesis